MPCLGACAPLLILFLLAAAPVARAQCLLANPSFEIPGSGGALFAGWNQFGSAGVSTDATHGFRAVRVSGPDGGGWEVSAVWQPLDTTPGDRWSASVRVRHSPVKPLTGECAAILNIEWRDAGGNLISYESHAVADASTPPGDWVDASVVSGAAPVGAAVTHFLLGVLQSPEGPSPDVFYDEAVFESLGPPTPEDLQWSDFPGGRTVAFGGRTWRVKGPGYYGPGPSVFCDTAECAWVDGDGRLHLAIRDLDGVWTSSEVALEEALGYGDYVFTTVGRIDTLSVHAVLGLFLWQYTACYDAAYAWWNPHDEIDVEIGRWGDPANAVGQFVVQPWDHPGNLHRFDATFSPGELASHAFRWLPDRVEYRSWRGGAGDEAVSPVIDAWTYTGVHLPRPERPRVHVNLWQFDGPPASEQEVVLAEFRFVPQGGAVDAPPVAEPRDGIVTSFSSVRPNPFASRTTVRYVMPRAGRAEITIHDVAGRLVRHLVRGPASPGPHETLWDGRDDTGHRLAAGVYYCRFRAEDVAETTRAVLVR